MSRGIEFRQDMPPPQGFPKIQYRRDLPKRGLNGYGLFAAGTAVLLGGFVVMGMQNRHTRALTQEKRRRRLNVACLLQAEEDRRYLRDLLERYKDEAKIVGVRKDFIIGESSYNNPDRFVLPIHVERVNT